MVRYFGFVNRLSMAQAHTDFWADGPKGYDYMVMVLFLEE